MSEKLEIFLKGSVAVWVFLFSESVHSMSRICFSI